MEYPSLLLFGPQTTFPSSEQFAQLRLFILQESKLQAFLDAVRDLPNFWHLLVETEPSFRTISGFDSIQVIIKWLENGETPASEDLSNVLRTPFTVIIHIIQYFQYLVRLPNRGRRSTHQEIFTGLKAAGIQGLCTGLLSAISVACSSDEEDVTVFAGVALRLAVCIGAYVDLDSLENPEDQGTCLIVRWKSDEKKEQLLELMSTSAAYISVVYDHNNATVTVLKSSVSSFIQALTSRGFLVKPIEVEGRFHSPIHQKTLEKIRDLCKLLPCIQLPTADSLLVPVRSNRNGHKITLGSLSEIAAASLLTDLSDWQQTVSETTREMASDSRVVEFGFCDVIPLSIARRSKLNITKMSNSANIATKENDYEYPENAVAIIGMACKYAGADSLEEFWELITEGTSMCEELPKERWAARRNLRSKDNPRSFGNFVRNPDAFDHRFFNKSSREAAAMDPQQRLLLQTAYQTLESSGYFGEECIEDDIGCYIGVATNDYHDNIASHPVTAFSALGELRAFLCGRISHHFGWTGPSLTYDTACSASLVAIDGACRAIQTGQCSRALAGGVSVNTNPNLWENLRGANFLSPSGPTKPFDSKADDYCRGEGVGLVFLKKLSEAIKDGDFVLGVVPASGVNQCKNETYITVPHGPSQSQLYNKILKDSGIRPSNISFVEAHGTGTQTGDPVEINSIRQVFGDSQRANTLYFGSVKGNVSHCEAASGVASVIKTVLMVENKLIPPLANHQSLNPKIPSLEASKMTIPKSLRPWNMPFRAAIVNNYGAAGSNAALIVGQACSTQSSNDQTAPLPRFPVYISAQSENSLHSYREALKSFVTRHLSELRLADLAYNLAKKQNRTLNHSFIGTVTSLSDFSTSLETFQPVSTPSVRKPVVLVFGGQTNNHVGLDENVYKSSILFRKHLNHCNEAIQLAGFKNIFPAIFQTEPVQDIVLLHSMFFAIQYASAKSWIDAGIQPAVIVGHSFGQLTGMHIAGCMSLDDAIKIVAGRAMLVQQLWGEDSGSMISVEADADTTIQIISIVSKPDDPVEIACYNGPKSHVIVGSANAIDRTEQLLVAKFGTIRYRRLAVTHGFHSRFTDPLLAGIKEIAAAINFSAADIPLETCTSGCSWDEITPAHIADHTRKPVYFQEAIERIAKRFGDCSWLESGSGSSVTGMVHRALASQSSDNTYHPVKLSGRDSLSGLADTTMNLWKCGHHVKFWPFHRSQSNQYKSIHLPPYQFEKTRHWLAWKESIEVTAAATPVTSVSPGSEKFELLICTSKDGDNIEFSIDPRNEEYKKCVKGHAVLDQPLCPADLYIELVSRAAFQITPQSSVEYIPAVEKLSIVSPLGVDPEKSIILSMIRKTKSSWAFSFSSRSRLNPTKTTKHAAGEISFSRLDDESLESEFARFEKLINLKQAMSLLADPETEGMQGDFVYKSFKRVVNYSDYYRGVKRIASKGDHVAAQISMPQDFTFADPLMDPVLIDNFVQVAGIQVNCLNHCPQDQVYICGYIERIQARKNFLQRNRESRFWSVVAHCTQITDKEYLNDIYVFDESNILVMLILGVRFTRVLISSLAKALTTASSVSNNQSKTTPMAVQIVTPRNVVELAMPNKPDFVEPKDWAPPQFPNSYEIYSRVRNLLNQVADIPLDSIKDNLKFEELGVDSLMSTELLGEINETFGVEISSNQFQELQDVASLGGYIIANSALNTSSSASSAKTSPTDSPTDYSEASSVTDMPIEKPEDSVVAELAMLVADFLETTAVMSNETCLGDCGLDSLMAVEMINEIESAYGINIDHDAIKTEITFGQLTQLVLPDIARDSNRQVQLEPANSQSLPFHSSSISPVLKDIPARARRMPGDRMKTVLFKQSGPTSLFADIYLPDASEVGNSKRPIALMIHGGGHTMLSRKDIRPHQTELLLANGLLPVSIDYRLCPEVNIIDGPMTDVCDALEWARKDLPSLDLGISNLRINGDQVVVIGWSTGGTLSLTLGFTAPKRGIRPPEAILAFYCPSNYEAECWKQPNYPENTEDKCPENYNLLEGVQSNPITAYNVNPKNGAIGGWMSLSDPRSRIVLHMNWKGQALPILLNGLPSKSTLAATSNEKEYLSLPQPSKEAIISISPYSQIIRGNYKVPTYLIHGTEDDLIPWQQMRDTYQALVNQGVEAGLGILDGGIHLFDLNRNNREGREWKMVLDGNTVARGAVIAGSEAIRTIKTTIYGIGAIVDWTDIPKEHRQEKKWGRIGAEKTVMVVQTIQNKVKPVVARYEAEAMPFGLRRKIEKHDKTLLIYFYEYDADSSQPLTVVQPARIENPISPQSQFRFLGSKEIDLDSSYRGSWLSYNCKFFTKNSATIYFTISRSHRKKVETLAEGSIDYLSKRDSDTDLNAEFNANFDADPKKAVLQFLTRSPTSSHTVADTPPMSDGHAHENTGSHTTASSSSVKGLSKSPAGAGGGQVQNNATGSEISKKRKAANEPRKPAGKRTAKV